MKLSAIFPHRSLILGSTLAVFVSSAHASNGMNLIAQHPRSAGMAGAGAAFLGGTDALHLNPAGLIQTRSWMWSAGVSVNRADLYQIAPNGQQFQDGLKRPLAPQLSVAGSNGDWAWGLGIVAQGGMGAEYADMVPPVPMAKGDKLKTQLGHLRLSSAVAWRLSPNWALGAALNLSQLRMEMAQFPETSFSQGGQRFFGLEVKDWRTWGRSVSAGLQYQNDAWSWGLSYTSESDFDLREGQASVNFSAMKLGKVNYQAALEGLAWPAQLTLAMGYQMTPRSRMALDYQWLNWSATHQQFDVILSASHPKTNPALPSELKQSMRLNWRDQHVIKAGWEYDLSPELGVSLGLNYARRPMQAGDVRAQFPAIAQTHLTAGLRFHTKEMEWNVALEVVPSTRLSNANPDRSVNVAGAGTQTQLRQMALSVGMTQYF